MPLSPASGRRRRETGIGEEARVGRADRIKVLLEARAVGDHVVDRDGEGVPLPAQQAEPDLGAELLPYPIGPLRFEDCLVVGRGEGPLAIGASECSPSRAWPSSMTYFVAKIGMAVERELHRPPQRGLVRGRAAKSISQWT